ncbi:AbrB family transcriptional regulator [Pantoea sp. FN060301]|uniref:AbrB family transcriptional regulator n=1 Tax=Pantoea sp. FN060301 TaxID=3420380 RepID=UPI003D163B0C
MNPIAVRWTGMILLSGLAVAGLESLHLPAALLLGPMAAGIVFAIRDKPVTIHRYLLYLAQGVVGCMIARSIPVTIFAEIGKSWPLFAFTILAVIATSTLLGGLLTRWQILPGSTAIWGASPGAATVMTLMSESYGADSRLVALMQYMRVMVVAIIATLVARIWAPPTGTVASASFDLFSPVIWSSFGATAALIIGGIMLSLVLRIPAGPLLLTLAGGVIAQDTGLLTIELPPALLMTAYAIIGWSIGLRFNRAILLYAAKTLPRLLMSIAVLVAICGFFAYLLVRFAGIDPLTAYLATSPGGADSVAIIAAASHVDMPFVMAMQTGRFILVLLTGPALARWVTRMMSDRWRKKEEDSSP